MGTTANSVLDQRLKEAIGDWLEFDTTTNITTNTSVLSTALNEYDDSEDDHFNGWWIYITEGNNITKSRKIADYATSGGTLTVYGAALSAEAGAVTCRLARYSWAAYQRAINKAIRELYPTLHRPLEDRTLVTNSVLPDGSFELWSSSSNPTLYSGSASATLARTTTAGYYRGPVGTTSMSVAAGAANQYAYLSSDSFPALLQLRDRTIDIAVWARPSTANDAYMDVVYTVEGSSTTVSTTTTCVADRFTKLERTGISIPSNAEKIEFRFRVLTNGETGYFDGARVIGDSIYEYVILSDFADGDLNQVYLQTLSNEDDPCDDLHPSGWERINGWYTYSDGTYTWLRLPLLTAEKYQLRLIGTAPISEVSAYTETVEIDSEKIDLLVNYAAYKLLLEQKNPPSTEGKTDLKERANEFLQEYYRLRATLGMQMPSRAMRFG